MSKKKKYGPKQGCFRPLNKDKYKGSYPIFARSSWEYKAFAYLDRNPNVIKWGSESIVVKYRDPSRNNTVHRYFIDLNMTIRTKDSKLQTYWIEIKPHKETQIPVKGRKKRKTYLSECATYARNQAKWKAASKAAKSKGAKFIIWTEKELQI